MSNNLLKDLEFTERLLHDSATGFDIVEHSVRHNRNGLRLSNRTSIRNPLIMDNSLESYRQYVFKRLALKVWDITYGDLLKDFTELVYSVAIKTAYPNHPIFSGINEFLDKWYLQANDLPEGFDFKTLED